MRTAEDFQNRYQDAQRFVKRHNKPVWIVPTNTTYLLSVVRPSPFEVPEGCSAILYDINMKAVDEVISARK